MVAIKKNFPDVFSAADSEINLLSSKLSGDLLRNSVEYSDKLNDLHADFERELDLERRKNRDLQETSRERDKEYQKLKVRGFPVRVHPAVTRGIVLPQAQYDKLKRRALLAPTVGASQPGINLTGGPEHPPVVNNLDVSEVACSPPKSERQLINPTLVNAETTDGKPHCGSI
jgi:hypothetical protein